MYQLQKIFTTKLFLILVVLGALFLLSGCSSDTNTLKTLPQIYLLAGETAVRTKEFCFYIGSNDKPKDQKIVTIPPAMFPELISNPVWSLPQGLELKSATINMEPCYIEWDGGDKQYSTDGVKLLVEYEVNAVSSVKAGEGDISINFESLNALKGDFIFWTDTLTTPKPNSGDAWVLNHVVIFTDAAEKEAATTKDNVNGILGLAVIAVIIIGVIMLLMWAFKKKS